MTNLHKAAERGDVKAIERLIDMWGGIDQKDGPFRQTPLHVAAWNGHIEVCALLLARGADINAKNRYGLSVLGHAAYQGHNEVVELLKKNGATEEPELTELHLAAWKGYEERVKDLIAAGAEVNVADDNGDTPLHYALRYIYPEVVILLLEHGANVNAKGSLATTPLHMAASNGLTEICSLLIECGADLNALNAFGLTPLNSANEHPETAALLREYGAKENEHHETAALLREHEARKEGRNE